MSRDDLLWMTASSCSPTPSQAERETSRERDKQRERKRLPPPSPLLFHQTYLNACTALFICYNLLNLFALRPVRASRITASLILGAQPPRSTTMRGTAPPNPRPPLLLILLPSPPAPLSLSLVNQLLLLLLNPPCFRAPVVWLSSGVGSRLSPCAFSLILYMLRSSSF